ncbi:hypothetical protein PoB_003845100 [Plakobranchus ocellatus]|uniref:Uncharacterized protein n=1 Tax=Plakobranchus ocellatus TaxID=259542 RepID=A0AAV4AUX9_9GAST|nr:hypothetical protein PoB_003845100 [Plakobranchus ocellatus]
MQADLRSKFGRTGSSSATILTANTCYQKHTFKNDGADVDDQGLPFSWVLSLGDLNIGQEVSLSLMDRLKLSILTTTFAELDFTLAVSPQKLSHQLRGRKAK